MLEVKIKYVSLVDASRAMEKPGNCLLNNCR